jgi:hypothetical protein
VVLAVQVACQIIISAVLLGGQSFLAQHGASVVTIVTDAIGNVNERGMLILLPVLETIITCYPKVRCGFRSDRSLFYAQIVQNFQSRSKHSFPYSSFIDIRASRQMKGVQRSTEGQ